MKADSRRPARHDLATPGHDRQHEREDWVLAAAGIALVVLVTPVTGRHLSFQTVAVAAPASVAVVFAASRSDRRLFAPLAALVGAILLSSALAPLSGHAYTFSIVSLVAIAGNFAPWPRFTTRRAARTVLLTFVVAPFATLLLVQALGWTDALGQLVRGELLWFGFSSPLTAWTFLWAVLALRILAADGATWTPLPQGMALLLLGATGSRAVGFAALVSLAIAIWADRDGLGQRLRRHWMWGLFFLTWLPRVLYRLAGSGGSDSVAGVSLTGRSTFWSTYWQEGRQFLPTGGGLGAIREIAGTHLRGFTPHNEYFWMAIDLGVVGALLIVIAWAVALWARRSWTWPRHPELLGPAIALPLVALVDDPLLGLTFPQPYLLLLAAAAPFAMRASAGVPATQSTSPTTTTSQ